MKSMECVFLIVAHTDVKQLYCQRAEQYYDKDKVFEKYMKMYEKNG